MVLSIDDFRFPKFVIQKERQPFGEDSNDKFYATDNTKSNSNARRFRDGNFPQQGYNVNDNTKEPIDQNINNESFALRPY